LSFLLAFVILYRGNIIASIFFISFGGLLVSILRQVCKTMLLLQFRLHVPGLARELSFLLLGSQKLRA